MTDEKFVTEEQLFERLDELVVRVSLWEGIDPEANSAILDELAFLGVSWPPGEGRELALDTCNRMARLIRLFEHRLGDEFDHVQKVLIAAIELLRSLAGDGDQVEKSLRRLHEVAGTAAREAGEEAGEEVEEEPPVPAAPSQVGQEPPRAGGDDGLFAGDRGFLSDFVWEATEHLEEIDTLLLDLEKSTICADTLNGLFRCFHTIKGVADFLGLVDISSLAHGVESLLDRHRESRIACEASTLTQLIAFIPMICGESCGPSKCLKLRVNKSARCKHSGIVAEPGTITC